MMRSLSLLVVIVCALIGVLGVANLSCQTPTNAERPQVNVPIALRQSNWKHHARGSCAHAALITALRWQGQFELADWWRRHHGGGAGVADMHAAMDAAGVRYAQTHDEADESFLEWAVATRRGCVVATNGFTHAVFLVHIDDQYVGLIGVNFTDPVIWVDREEFLNEWRASRSWAFAVVYSPAPPLVTGEE